MQGIIRRQQSPGSNHSSRTTRVRRPRHHTSNSRQLERQSTRRRVCNRPHLNRPPRQQTEQTSLHPVSNLFSTFPTSSHLAQSRRKRHRTTDRYTNSSSEQQRHPECSCLGVLAAIDASSPPEAHSRTSLDYAMSQILPRMSTACQKLEAFSDDRVKFPTLC